jgi:hypothetical protein
VLAAGFATWTALAEGAKVGAGYSGRPATSQLWLFAIVILMSGSLGWITAPRSESVVPGLLKNLSVVTDL